MWKLFGYAGSQGESKELTPSPDDNLHQLKHQIENKLKQLQRLYQQSQSHFQHHYVNKEPDEILTTTFRQLIATIEGLITMLVHLRAEYEHTKDQLQEHHQLKQMISNHQDIVSAIQDSHSQQVASLYQQKSQIEQQLRQQIAELSQTAQKIKHQLQITQNQLSDKQNQNEQLRKVLGNVEGEASSLKERAKEAEIKYRAIVEQADPPQIKKVVDLEHIKLDYLFYYGKIRQNIVAFFDVKDLVRLQQVSKFYQLTLKKQQPRNFYLSLKRQFENKLTQEIRNAKTYHKIYELFPSENIKSNALKYLYFKIKPAAYILPYLQEQPHEPSKQEQENQQKGKNTQKFNWKTLFNSDKTIKSEKKEESKFTLSALRNEEEFKRTEGRIEALFKNILPIKMPEDLRYFSETMQSQLQELKVQLAHNKGKGTQAEWTAQIFCLSRYMYHQINELYSLLQVIFGELVAKNKELIGLRESYQYMSENELVLRNLIENISNDKASSEKRLFIIENDILKIKLERQAISNTCDRLTSENSSLKRKLESLEAQHAICKRAIHSFQSEHKQWQKDLARIRQEIDNIENYSGRIRKGSLGSVSSQQQAGQEATG